jgi:hypothetical protein
MTPGQRALQAARAVATGTPEPTKPTRAAPMVVTLPPSAFSAEWSKRPTEPEKIGLRLVSETTNDQARAEATRSADAHYREALNRDSEEYVLHFNGVLIREVLAQACCKPDDVTKTYFEGLPNMMVRAALTEGGVQRLWHGYLELREQLSPLQAPATDDDLEELGVLLTTEARARISEGDRRILARLLDDLQS